MPGTEGQADCRTLSRRSVGPEVTNSYLRFLFYRGLGDASTYGQGNLRRFRANLRSR